MADSVQIVRSTARQQQIRFVLAPFNAAICTSTGLVVRSGQGRCEGEPLGFTNLRSDEVRESARRCFCGPSGR
jgi:hypothetical protein